MSVITSAPVISRDSASSVREVIDFCNYQHARQFDLTIETDFVGPTDTTGSCYRAHNLLGNEIHFESAQYDLTTPENHLRSAMGLIREFLQGCYQLKAYESTETGYRFAFTRIDWVD